jgi:Fic family protein
MLKLPSESILSLAGYAILIEKFSLKLPTPDLLIAISTKNKNYKIDNWRILSVLNKPREDTLYAHLEFALKFEGIDLLVLAKLFQVINKVELEEAIKLQPTSKYTRQIWFLYEWLTGKLLDIADLSAAFKLRYENVVNSKLQYPSQVSVDSKRHKIRNNLPGTKNFCPLIRRTEKLENFLQQSLAKRISENIGEIHPDLLMRAAAFLLLDDSKASYAIEGETPPHNRAERWARAIGRAGETPLTLSELERLQREVVGEERFIKMGYRKEGGFIGTRDRQASTPIPVHISAKAQDLELLMTGLIETASLFKESNYPPVFAAAAIAFGFVFIHPFEDGNGRLHRYLIHHMLAERTVRKRTSSRLRRTNDRSVPSVHEDHEDDENAEIEDCEQSSETGFTPAGIVFPISAVILKRLPDYKKVLEAYSQPRLPHIDWKPTLKGNVEVLNETIDFYRYFDATVQAEFLCDCILETVNEILPKEIDYLRKYDQIKSFINSYIEMPDNLVDLLINFLYQNQGKLSKRAREKEFVKLTEEETEWIEARYEEVFNAL